jgi:hypothetical protein
MFNRGGIGGHELGSEDNITGQKAMWSRVT